MRQTNPGQWQAPWASVPHHGPCSHTNTPHPNQRCTLPGQDSPAGAWRPSSRRTRHRSQGPRPKLIQAILHQSTPKTRTPTPAQTPTSRPAPSPGLRPQMANSKRGCEKYPKPTSARSNVV
ncbi:hypothetical protein ATANTOWER_029720 [Ataeniobius toweri]|uniref:Uncharacterized protein n=1 Tax=Ataeniobius toweri TaxID=208326 RepID=A0ABU7B922_9TELE|nr:hypothetical protein [Ataeniobius toweri]